MIFIIVPKKPNLLITNDGGEIVNKISTDFLNKKNNKKYSRNTSLEAVFAESFNRTVRDLLKKPVFEKSDGYITYNNETKY